MDIKEIIKHLEATLLETAKKYAINEVQYRGMTSLVMATQKPDEKMLAFQTAVTLNKEIFERDIRNLRGLIAEIQEGKFVI